MEPKKIIIHHLPKTGVGGIETWLLNLIKYTISRKTSDIELLLILRSRGKMHEDFIQTGCNVVMLGRYRYIAFAMRRAIKLFKTIKSGSCVLHLHDHSLYALMLCLVTKCMIRSKIILHIHNSVNNNQNRLKLMFEKVQYSLIRLFAEKILFCSSQVRHGWDPCLSGSKSGILRYGLPDENFSGQWYTYKKRITNSSKFFLILARFAEQKNPEFIMGLARSIKDTNWIIEWYGDGVLRPSIEARIKAEGLGHVIKISEPIAQPWLNLDLNKYECLLLPSFYEGFPVVLVESQYHGFSAIISNQISDEALMDELIVQLPIGENNIHLWVAEMNKLTQEVRQADRKIISEFFHKNELTISQNDRIISECYYD